MKRLMLFGFIFTATMALDYKYQGANLTPDNLEKVLQDAGKVVTGELRDKLLAELNKYAYGKDNKSTVARLIRNPNLWSQSRSETYMRTNLIKKQFNQDGMQPYASSNHVFRFEVDGKAYVAIIASVENRLINLERQHGTKEYFYGYKTGQLDAETLDNAIKTDEKTYQTSSNLARTLLAQQALGNLNVHIPDAKLLKFDENSDISDTNAIVVEEFIGKIIPLTDYILSGNDLTPEQVMVILTAAVRANLWDLGQISIAEDGSVVLLNLEQPDKTRPSDEFFVNSTEIFEDPYSAQIDLQNNTKALISQLFDLLKTANSKQTNVLVIWVKTNETLLKFDNFDKFLAKLQ